MNIWNVLKESAIKKGQSDPPLKSTCSCFYEEIWDQLGPTDNLEGREAIHEQVILVDLLIPGACAFLDLLQE